MSKQFNSKQGGWCHTNKPTTTAPSITTTGTGYPQISTIWSSGYVTTGSNPTKPYVLFKLPINKLPDLVFVNGRALSLGILGSKAECAFGAGSLVFSGQVFAELPAYHFGKPGLFTLILQYKTKTFHYCAEVDSTAAFVALKPGTNIIDAEPLCEIKRF